MKTLPINPALLKSEPTAVVKLNQAIEALTDELWIMVPKCSGDFDTREEQLDYIIKTGLKAKTIRALLSARADML
jgi:hypothetical protein